MKDLEVRLMSAISEASRLLGNLSADIVQQEEISHNVQWVEYRVTYNKTIEPEQVTETTWQGLVQDDPALNSGKTPKGERNQYTRKIIDQPRIAHPDKEKREQAGTKLEEMFTSCPWVFVREQIYEGWAHQHINFQDYAKIFNSWLLQLQTELGDEKTREKAEIDLDALFEGYPNGPERILFSEHYAQEEILRTLAKGKGLTEAKYQLLRFSKLPDYLDNNDLRTLYQSIEIDEETRIIAGRELIFNLIQTARHHSYNELRRNAKKELKELSRNSEFEDIRRDSRRALSYTFPYVAGKIFISAAITSGLIYGAYQAIRFLTK